MASCLELSLVDEKDDYLAGNGDEEEYKINLWWSPRRGLVNTLGFSVYTRYAGGY